MRLINMLALLPAVVGILLIPCSGEVNRVDLSGTIVHPDGSPVSGATVFINTAAPKVGFSSVCPSCYVDCAKSARTDAAGRFTIRALDSSLFFQVLAVAHSHQSAKASRIDPAAGEIKITLTPFDENSVDPKLRIVGVVMDGNGGPVGGAVVNPEGAKLGRGTSWGGVDRFVDPIAVTQPDGRFLLVCKQPADAIHATVKARGSAERWVELKPGRDHLIRLQEGAAVTGRILRQGKPVKNVQVGLITTDRAAGRCLRVEPIATDAEGRFLLANVPAETSCWLYATMDSLQGVGMVPAQQFTTGKTGSTWDAGEMKVEQGYTLAGRIVLSDQAPIPEGTRLNLGLQGAWDHTETKLDSNGHFEFRNVPPGPASLFVRIREHHFSTKNPSLDWMNNAIVGTVDQSLTNLDLVMEPGENQTQPRPSWPDFDPQPYKKPLRGVEP